MNDPSGQSGNIDLQLKRVGVILGWMLAVAGACYTLYLVRTFISGVFDVLTPFLGAAVLAYILDPIVTGLQRRFRLSRVWGLIVCYTLVILAAGTFLVTLVPIVKKQSVAASSAIARAVPAVTYRILEAAHLSEDDFKASASFIVRLREGRDAPSRYLFGRSSQSLRTGLSEYDPATTPSTELMAALADDLNRVVKTDRLQDQQAFGAARLSPETRDVIDRDRGRKEQPRINRLILQDAFPQEIARSHALGFLSKYMTEEFRDQLLQWASQKQFDFEELKGVLPATHKALDVLYSQFHTLAAGILGSFNSAISVFTAALFVIIISFYFIIDFDKFGYFLRVVIPAGRQERVFEILKKMDRAVGGFLRGQLAVCFCVGTMSTLGLLLLGFHTPALARYCLLIGILAGVANFIPYLGPILGAAPAILIVLFSPPGPGEAITWSYRLWGVAGIGALSALIQTTEGFVLQPYVVGANSGLHPLLVMLALIAGAQFGLGGMIVAIPVAAMARVLVKELWWDKLAETERRRTGARSDRKHTT